MFFFCIVIIIACIYQLITLKRIEFSDFSRDKTTVLKGILALCVLIGHLSYLERGAFPYSGLYGLGLIAVNVFLFMSGYGLMLSFKLKGKAYLNNFFTKRIWKILLPFLLAIILYTLMRLLFSDLASVKNHFLGLSLKYIDGILPFSWYVFVIIYLYISFYVVVKFTSSPKLIILFLLLSVLLFMFLSNMKMQFPPYWYRSSLAFVMGIIWSAYNTTLVNVYKKYTSLILGVIILWMAYFCYFDISENSALHNMLIPVIFIILSYRFNFHSKVLEFLGNISYEIYLTQGIAMLICQQAGLNKVYYSPYFFATIALTIILAYLLNRVSFSKK